MDFEYTWTVHRSKKGILSLSSVFDLLFSRICLFGYLGKIESGEGSGDDCKWHFGPVIYFIDRLVRRHLIFRRVSLGKAPCRQHQQNNTTGFGFDCKSFHPFSIIH